MPFLHATRGKLKKQNKKESLLPELRSSSHESKSQGLSENKVERKPFGRSQPRGTETTYVYLLCYLFISGRVHYKYFSFFKKISFIYEKIVIIGSSDSHNYDSHTVELKKAASARRGLHADRRPALNRRQSYTKKTDSPPVLN